MLNQRTLPNPQPSGPTHPSAGVVWFGRVAVGAMRNVEWPTWLLIFTIYGGWLSLVLAYRFMPAWLAHPALVLVVAWHMSLQHELLHGHPTRNKALSRLLGIFPMSAWYPYDIYRDSHLSHHRDELLTTPGIDPECNYLEAHGYEPLWKILRLGRWSLRTVLGRLLLGPAYAIAMVWGNAARELFKRDFRYLPTWLVHLSLLLVMLYWLNRYAGIAPLFYLFAIAYPALSLAMLRSFFEHRPAALPAHRTVINDASLPWRLLYLNNNYHSVHHDHPGLAWYRIPAAYRADREGFVARNNGFHIPGYAYLLWKHGVKPVDSPVHPGFG